MAVATIGLTGGIGSGKSTVAGLLVQAFGAGILGLDGALDRARMRELVFAEPAAKARLEQLLHPLIGAAAQARAAQAAGRPVVFDVPLLTESAHWRARVDRVLVVDCPAALQVERVMRRSGWDAAAVQRVIDQQASRERRRAIADAVIYNGGSVSLSQLAAQVRELWAAWVDRGARRAPL